MLVPWADGDGRRHSRAHARSPTRSVTLRNLTLIEAEGASYRIRQVSGRGVLPDVIEEHFLIPCHITRQALEGIELTAQP